jgi:hypothetical protein
MTYCKPSRHQLNGSSLDKTSDGTNAVVITTCNNFLEITELHAATKKTSHEYFTKDTYSYYVRHSFLKQIVRKTSQKHT